MNKPLWIWTCTYVWAWAYVHARAHMWREQVGNCHWLITSKFLPQNLLQSLCNSSLGTSLVHHKTTSHYNSQHGCRVLSMSRRHSSLRSSREQPMTCQIWDVICWSTETRTKASVGPLRLGLKLHSRGWPCVSYVIPCRIIPRYIGCRLFRWLALKYLSSFQ